MSTSSPLAPFNGETPWPWGLEVCKTSVGRVACPPAGFNSLSLRQTCERPNSRRPLVLARLIPVGRFAFRANSRFSLRTFAWHPFMGASGTFIPLLLNSDQHDQTNILENPKKRADRASRCPMPCSRLLSKSIPHFPVVVSLATSKPPELTDSFSESLTTTASSTTLKTRH